MPATTALTAAVSTGLTPRTSSREMAAWLSRHGTSAAAAMQIKTALARTGESSSNNTRIASAMAATSKMMAERRSRSGQGEKNDEEEDGASNAILPASSSLSTIGLVCRVRSSHHFAASSIANSGLRMLASY